MERRKSKRYRMQRDQARVEAGRDYLTGLPNERAFIAYAEERIKAHAREEDSTPAYLLFFDLDKFKQVNDTLGHEVGDSVLTLAAAALQGLMRKGDLIARLHGDEFGAFARCTLEDVQALTSRVRPAVEEAIRAACAQHGHVPPEGCSVSVGYAEYGKDGTTLEDLKKASDLAMYEDKAIRK